MPEWWLVTNVRRYQLSYWTICRQTNIRSVNFWTGQLDTIQLADWLIKGNSLFTSNVMENSNLMIALNNLKNFNPQTDQSTNFV